MSEHVPISVDPAAINEYIAKQIIDSALGERLKETVHEALEAFGRYSNDPLKSAVIGEVNKHVMTFVREEFKDQIEEAVREHMTPEFINNLAQGFVSSITSKIDQGRY